jgi:transposase
MPARRSTTAYPPTPEEAPVIVGIDSHKSSLAACAVDRLGRQLAGAQFANDPAGHRALLAWARQLAPQERRFGLESSGYFA